MNTYSLGEVEAGSDCRGNNPKLLLLCSGNEIIHHSFLVVCLTEVSIWYERLQYYVANAITKHCYNFFRNIYFT